MVYAKSRIRRGEWDAQRSLGFWDTNGSPNLDQTTRPNNNNQQKKETCRIVDSAVSTDHRIKLKESEKKDKYLDLARKLKKLWNMKVTFMPNAIGTLGIVNKAMDTRTGKLGNKKTCGHQPNYCIIGTSQNTQKSPGDLRRQAVTQTPVKDHLLKLNWKTIKE